jgi:hypothetical protein
VTFFVLVFSTYGLFVFYKEKYQTDISQEISIALASKQICINMQANYLLLLDEWCKFIGYE